MTNPTDAASHRPDDPVALVARLWQQQPLTAHDALGDGAEARVAGIRDALAALASEATRIADEGASDDRVAARLLAETARAMHAALATSLSRATQRPGLAGATRTDSLTPWVDRLRFARMERWLASRAEDDADVEPSASLCLWVTEHLEMAAS